MARRYNRRGQRSSGRGKKDPIDRIVASSNLGYLKGKLSRFDNAIAELDKELDKIQNITDREAENYIHRFRELFQKIKDKRLELDFEKLREELITKYGTELWSYTSIRPSYHGGPLKIYLSRLYMAQHGHSSSEDMSQSIQSITSPSAFREYLSKINMRSLQRSIVTRISTRISQVESSKSHMKEAKVRAIIAREEGASRSLGRSVKKELEVTEDCPYCGESLGRNYHADHIIPITIGGGSARQNMVNVCAKCNLKKGGDTLFKFCQKNGYDFSVIARRLQSMSKQV